jgi:hypothetical protein
MPKSCVHPVAQDEQDRDDVEDRDQRLRGADPGEPAVDLLLDVLAARGQV